MKTISNDLINQTTYLKTETIKTLKKIFNTPWIYLKYDWDNFIGEEKFKEKLNYSKPSFNFQTWEEAEENSIYGPEQRYATMDDKPAEEIFKNYYGYASKTLNKYVKKYFKNKKEFEKILKNAYYTICEKYTKINIKPELNKIKQLKINSKYHSSKILKIIEKHEKILEKYKNANYENNDKDSTIGKYLTTEFIKEKNKRLRNNISEYPFHLLPKIINPITNKYKNTNSKLLSAMRDYYNAIDFSTKRRKKAENKIKKNLEEQKRLLFILKRSLNKTVKESLKPKNLEIIKNFINNQYKNLENYFNRINKITK